MHCALRPRLYVGCEAVLPRGGGSPRATPSTETDRCASGGGRSLDPRAVCVRCRRRIALGRVQGQHRRPRARESTRLVDASGGGEGVLGAAAQSAPVLASSPGPLADCALVTQSVGNNRGRRRGDRTCGGSNFVIPPQIVASSDRLNGLLRASHRASVCVFVCACVIGCSKITKKKSHVTRTHTHTRTRTRTRAPRRDTRAHYIGPERVAVQSAWWATIFFLMSEETAVT